MPNPTPKFQQFLALAIAIGLATWLIVTEQDRADRAEQQHTTVVGTESAGTSETSPQPEADGSPEGNGLHRVGQSEAGEPSLNQAQADGIAAALHANDPTYLQSSKVLTLRMPNEFPSPRAQDAPFLFSSKSMVLPEAGNPRDLRIHARSIYDTWSTEDLRVQRERLEEQLRQIDEALRTR